MDGCRTGLGCRISFDEYFLRRGEQMDWMSGLGDLFERYSGSPAQLPRETIESDYDRVAQHAPTTALRGGLADAFRSDETPPFPQMLSQLFGRSGGQQKAGILNMLISMLGPQILASILSKRGGGGSGGGGGILSDIINGRKSTVTPEEAEQIDPATVEDIAAEAEQKDPSIVDQASDFYAEHPALVKGLGVAALAFLMSRLSGGGPFGR
jgi:hypothetical protein